MHGSKNDDVRRHNLATILGIVHHDGATPRSQITRLTGLNRSTVAALVAELVELGLVVEREADATKMVGRPSPLVAPVPEVVALAVNPEIDAVTIAVVGLGGHVHSRVRHATERSPGVHEAVAIAESVIESMRAELDARFRVVGIGLAVPGQVRSTDGVVRLAPHLGWVDSPVASLLADATGYPSFAGNDAALGAIAEWHFGAGRGARDLVYLNGGASGIGGGVIAHGAPLGGVSGFAGEFGHIRVSAASGGAASVDSAGIAGTLESEVRLSALLDVLGLSADRVEDLDAALSAAFAADGAEGAGGEENAANAAVRAEVARQLLHIGTALGATVNVLNPELIVLGGFLGSLLAVDSATLTEVLNGTALAAPREDVAVLRAELGPNLLMVGGAELAFAPLLSDPAGFAWSARSA